MAPSYHGSFLLLLAWLILLLLGLWLWDSQERFYFGDNVLPCFESAIPMLKNRLHDLPDADNVSARAWWHVQPRAATSSQCHIVCLRCTTEPAVVLRMLGALADRSVSFSFFSDLVSHTRPTECANRPAPGVPLAFVAAALCSKCKWEPCGSKP